uniref:Nuclear pore membrane glycoprotein 210 n=1 Tax=Romanomermis culicivorax TaxID=13658 RepID=A0A915L4Y8_ROMCU
MNVLLVTSKHYRRMGCFFAPKLNVPKILLPFHSSNDATTFKLEVSNNDDDPCFFWKSTRPDVAVVLFDEPCSKEAVVQGVSREKKKSSSVVLAEDRKTGFILKCDVIVDVIDKIEIQTTTKELYMDDAPEIFSVVAKNDQNDTFSSLNGLIFDWKLENLGGPSSKLVLNFVNFENSEYKGTENIKNLERLGLKGEKVLVEGVGTGRASLSSKLMDSLYTEIESEKIDLAVVAHLLLDPAHDLYILIDSTVTFKTNIVKQGALHPLILNDTKVKPPYNFRLDNAEICRLNHDFSVTALTLGQTNLELIDKNDDSNVGNLPSLMINVVEPFSLRISILPGYSWVLEVGRKYVLSFKLLTDDMHEIYVTKDIKFKTVIAEDYFRVDYESINGSYIVVTPKKSGQTQIQGRYRQFSSSEDVEIYDPLEIEPNNKDVASVTTDGFVELGSAPGFAHLSIFDAKNHLHKSVGKVIISEVHSLQVLDGHRDLEVGAILRLPVVAFTEVELSAKQKVQYSNCSLLSYEIRSVDDSVQSAFTSQDAETDSGSCGNLFIKATKVGIHDVTILLNRYNLEPIKLELRINVYPPLNIVDPSGELVLMVGSEWKVITRGGPPPNSNSPRSYEATAQSKDQGDIIEVENLADFPTDLLPNDQHEGRINSFSVYCRKFGAAKILFHVTNGKSLVSNIFSSSNVSLKVHCVWPDRLAVKQAMIDAKNCPTSNSYETLHYKMPTLFSLQAYDSYDRELLNLSSSKISWEVESHKENSGSNENEESLLSERIDSDDGFAKFVYGSGHYEIETRDNHDDVAVFSLKTSALQVKPKIIGSTSVRIKDLCMYRADKTMVNVNVFDVANVLLNGPDMVEIGKSTTLSVFLISEDGRTLSGAKAKQILNMRLDFSDEFFTLEEQSLISSQDSHHFTFTAKKLGSADIFASIVAKDAVLKSNTHSIQLETIGGPRDMKLEFNISEKSIANVRNDGLIHALKLGQTEICGSFSSNGLTLSKDVIRLNVVNLAKIKIHSRSAAIYNGTSITLFADGISKDGTQLNALSWTNTDTPLKFSWSSDDSNFLFGRDLVSSLENRFAVVFYANKPGMQTIRLQVTSAIAGHSPNAIFPYGVVELNDKIEILCLESPRFEHIDKNVDKPILMTPNTEIRLEANRNKYQKSFRALSDDGLIDIVDSDLLRSSGKKGVSIVQGDVQISNSLNESLSILVKVQPVHHIEAHYSDTFEWGQTHYFPVGCTVNFFITGHTAFGDRFSALNLNVTVRPNRFDLAKLELNHKLSRLSVTFRTEGDISVKISDEGTLGFLIYLHLVAKRLISSPTDSSLNVGDFVCLDSSMAAEREFEKQAWQTSNPLSIKTLTNSGLIFANSGGSAVVSYVPNNLCSSKIRFSVDKIVDLEVVVDKKQNLPSYGTHGDHFIDIPIILNSQSKAHSRKVVEPACLTKIESLVNTDPLIERWLNDLKFLKCHLSFLLNGDLDVSDDEQVFRRLNIDVNPKFSIEMNSYVCRLHFGRLSSKIAEEMSHFQRNATLFVRYKSSSGESEIVKDSNFVIYGPIFIRQSLIKLSKSDTSGKFLTIFGPRDLLSHIVLTSNTNGAVIFGKSLVNISTNSVKIPYKLSKRPLTSHIKDSTQNYSFTLSCSLTGQKVEIPLKFELLPEDYHKTSFWTFMQSLIDLYGSLLLIFSTIIATVICLLIGYKVLYNGSGDGLLIDQNSVKLDTSRNSAMESSVLQTPNRTPFRNLNQSGTPYLWSVNRSQQMTSSPR